MLIGSTMMAQVASTRTCCRHTGAPLRSSRSLEEVGDTNFVGRAAGGQTTNSSCPRPHLVTAAICSIAGVRLLSASATIQTTSTRRAWTSVTSGSCVSGVQTASLRSDTQRQSLALRRFPRQCVRSR
jgi:hypothetical protein